MIPARPATRHELRVRFLACLVVTAGFFLLLLVRLFHLQVVAGGRYRDLSENNRIRIERIPPQRGVVFDRNGQLLAGTHVSFDADIIPAEIPKERAGEIFAKAATLLSMPEEEIRRLAAQKNPPPWLPRVLKRRLSREEMARLDARRLDLPGIFVSATPVRHYPYGTLLGPTLGYTGTITPEETEIPAFAEYDPSDYIGRAGIERVWEGMLRGTAGGTHVEVDVLGRRLKEVAEKPATAGHNIVLTIDLQVQQAAAEALGEKAGSVVVLDVTTGEVLAMVSRPSYDPNELTVGLDAEAWNRLSSDPFHPLNNRPTQGVYAPGSTFKIVMALAGLDRGAVTPLTQVFCEGSYTFGGRTFRCWKPEGHGTIDLEHALEQSCDVYFYQLGVKLGVDAIHEYALRLGLGAVTGIDLPNEKGGTIPSAEWKRRVLNAPWYAGETVSVAIGQGYVTVTPLQLAVMTAAVAHPSGALMRPHLVKRIEDSLGHPVMEITPEEMGRTDLKPAHLDAVRHGMRMVVEGDGGTARRAAIEGFPVAGKTGTAQVVSMRGERPSREGMEWQYRDHALFVAFAPAPSPRYAVSVVVDHGGHGGSEAAPVAKAVLEACRDLHAPQATSARREGGS